ncbi:MAG: hypothetical protein K6E54_11090, partial [Bacteroidaceae bacterium]|nr:hypothetical protein [Bacteroidaceae bacterium]
MKVTSRNILNIILATISISAIASQTNGNSAFLRIIPNIVNTSNELSDSPSSPQVKDVNVVEDDSIKVKKTDYPQGNHPEDYPMDLQDPENLKHDEGTYDEKSGYYKVGTKLGDNYLSAPILMTPEEYL